MPFPPVYSIEIVRAPAFNVAPVEKKGAVARTPASICLLAALGHAPLDRDAGIRRLGRHRLHADDGAGAHHGGGEMPCFGGVHSALQRHGLSGKQPVDGGGFQAKQTGKVASDIRQSPVWLDFAAENDAIKLR